MPTTQDISRETVSGEALFILKNLKENGRLGRSNKLADVKAMLEPSVSLEFDSYFFFLRKFHYIAMDREAQLKLTDQGDKVVDGDHIDKFTDEVGQFFSDQLAPETQGRHEVEEMEPTAAGQPSGARPPPPPPETVLSDAGPFATGRAMSPPPVDEFPVSRAPTRDVAAVSNSKRDHSHMPVNTPAPSAIPSVAPVAALSSAIASASRGSDENRYVKGDPVGSGPLGSVFRAKHTALGTEVCVKELKDIFGYFSFLQRGEVIKRLKKEICAQAQIRHPAVVTILDQSTEVARPYYVLELMKSSLREKLDQSGGKGLPVKDAMRIFMQLCYGMRAAHASGLMHHNIKPENVLFDLYGNAKLADFGLGRVMEVDQAKGMPQVFVGTAGMPYMAPELMSRSKEAGPSADVYGVGILFYELVTGQVPGRRSPMPSEVIGELPKKMDSVFDRMTADKKDQRYQDIESVLDDAYGAYPGHEMLAKGDLILWSQPNRSETIATL